MAAAGAIMGIAGGVVGAVGAKKEGDEAEAAANYNANIERQEGAMAVEEAQENAKRQNIQSRYQLGGIRADIGVSGIQRTGSALDVLQESAANAEMDRLTILHKGDMENWSHQVNAQTEEFKGQQAQEQARFAAAGSLLGAGAKASTMKFGKAQAPSGGGYGERNA